MPTPRVASLIASATETMAALGLADLLVGRSHECDFPPDVLRLPICSQPKIDYHTSSFRIDQQIKSLLQDGLAIYQVNADLLRELRPDVILTQTHCEVCAVSEKDVQDALCQWLGGQPRLVSLHPDCLADVWAGMHAIAAACGQPERGENLVSRLQAKMQELAAPLPATPLTLGCIEWVEPLMVAGNWLPELVTLAGAVDPLGRPGRHSPLCSWDRFAEADPDVILISPCGYDLQRTREELPLLEKQQVWPTLRAVRAGRVYLVDGNAFFNRPGPRLVESLQILREIIDPGRPASLRGTGWEPVSANLSAGNPF